MSPTGHRLTAVALACAGAWIAWQRIGPAQASLFFAGAALGARAPDWLEGAIWLMRRRYALLPHRTVTHWWGIWIALGAAGYDFVPGAPAWLVFGVAASALLHILIDAMTPAGVPLLHPFAARASLRMFRSGAVLEETLVAAICWAVALLAIFLHSARQEIFTGIF